MATALDQLTIKDTLEQLGKSVEKAKELLSDTMEDSTASARRLIKRGRNAVEHATDQGTYAIRRRPYRSVGLAFSAGIALGFLIGLVRKK